MFCDLLASCRAGSKSLRSINDTFMIIAELTILPQLRDAPFPKILGRLSPGE
jgi:hypothetical protein